MNSSTIFFSYSRQDATDFAFKLASDLKAAGANIWIDQLNITPGKNWDEEIEKALKDSKYVLFIASQMSVSSQNVLNEIYYAVDEMKTVIPIRMHDCTIPFRIRRFQYIDFTGDYTTALDRLIKYLELQVTTDSSNSTLEPKSVAGQRAQLHENVKTAERTPPASKSKKRILLALAAVIVVVLVVFGIMRNRDQAIHTAEDIASNIDTMKAAATDTVLLPTNSDSIEPAPNTSTPVVQTQPVAANAGTSDPADETNIEASYPGGRAGLTTYFRRAVVYPAEARRAKIEGVVVVRFVIETDGRIGEVTVVSGPKGGGLRTEAIRVVKASGPWQAAVKNGRKVRAFRRIGVPFKLDQ